MSYYKIRPKSGTASAWSTANPVLNEREIGFEYPSGGLGTGFVKMKMGDGSTAWNDLPYAIVSPVVENQESTSTESVPSSNYVKEKFDIIGTTRNATWSPTGSSAVGTALTGAISLEAGTYIITASLPTISTDIFTAQISGLSNRVLSGHSWANVAFIEILSTTTSIQLISAQSAACNFSNRERGGLRVVRIA